MGRLYESDFLKAIESKVNEIVLVRTTHGADTIGVFSHVTDSRAYFEGSQRYILKEGRQVELANNTPTLRMLTEAHIGKEEILAYLAKNPKLAEHAEWVRKLQPPYTLPPTKITRTIQA